MKCTRRMFRKLYVPIGQRHFMAKHLSTSPMISTPASHCAMRHSTQSFYPTFWNTFFIPTGSCAIHRVLRPGATALINTPFLYLIHEAPYDFYRYTPYALERMAGSAGLEVIQLDLIGGGMLVIADVLGKLLSNLPVGGAHLASALQRVVLLASRDLPQTSAYPLFVAAVLKKPLTNGA